MYRERLRSERSIVVVGGGAEERWWVNECEFKRVSWPVSNQTGEYETILGWECVWREESPKKGHWNEKPTSLVVYYWLVSSTRSPPGTLARNITRLPKRGPVAAYSLEFV